MASGVQYLGRSVKQHGLADFPNRSVLRRDGQPPRRSSLIERINGPGRAIRHRLTPTGETQLETGQKAVTGVFEASFATLTKAQRKQLQDLITAVLASPIPD
jgi:DNA-binding MarR family transcriptional regulator